MRIDEAGRSTPIEGLSPKASSVSLSDRPERPQTPVIAKVRPERVLEKHCFQAMTSNALCLIGSFRQNDIPLGQRCARHRGDWIVKVLDYTPEVEECSHEIILRRVDKQPGPMNHLAACFPDLGKNEPFEASI